MTADLTQTAAFARVRSALSGRCRIERELGVGGMATVYLATDVRHHGEADGMLFFVMPVAAGPERRV
jgi:hypothetical protein